MRPLTKYLRSIILLITMSVLILVACGKEDLSDTNGLMRGQMLSKVTAEGIPDINILLEITNSLLDNYKSSTSDENGYFEIKHNTDGYMTFRIMWVSENPHNPNNYQSSYWINNDSMPYSGYELKYNLDQPETLKVELFPRTYFNLKINNTSSSSPEDMLNLTIHNMIKEDDPWARPMPVEYTFDGVVNDLIIEGELYKGNEIKLVYQVINEEGNKKYSKVITCKPGGMTELNIEY